METLATNEHHLLRVDSEYPFTFPYNRSISPACKQSRLTETEKRSDRYNQF